MFDESEEVVGATEAPVEAPVEGAEVAPVA